MLTRSLGSLERPPEPPYRFVTQCPMCLMVFVSSLATHANDPWPKFRELVVWHLMRGHNYNREHGDMTVDRMLVERRDVS